MRPAASKLSKYFIPAILTAILIVFGVSTRGFQVAAIICLFILLILIRFLFKDPTRSIRNISVQSMVMAAVTFLVQALVLATGGFYSQFIVTIHLVTLGVGFFEGMTSSTAFLSGTVIALILHLRFDDTIVYIFQDDPWTVVLYILSFIAMLPVIYQLIDQYQLKNKIVGFLSNQIQVNTKRESSILHGLQEMVVVLNPKLQILSVNQPVRTLLNKENKDMLFRSVFEVLPIQDMRGDVLNEESLGIERIKRDKAARIMTGFVLKPLDSKHQAKVDMQVRPVVNPAGEIEQIVLVINESTGTATNPKQHPYSDEFSLLHSDRFENAITLMHKRGLPELDRELRLLKRSSDDLMLLYILEDQTIQEQATVHNMVTVGKNVIEILKPLAQTFGVEVTFAEEKLQRSAKDPILPKQLMVQSRDTPSDEYNAAIDERWMGEILERLLRLAILLSASDMKGQVRVRITADEANVHMILETTFKGRIEDEELYQMNYPSLKSHTMLQYGSGAEGLIIQLISEQITGGVTYSRNESGQFIITILIPKGPDQHQER